jgi:hypothetical protein
MKHDELPTQTSPKRKQRQLKNDGVLFRFAQIIHDLNHTGLADCTGSGVEEQCSAATAWPCDVDITAPGNAGAVRKTPSFEPFYRLLSCRKDNFTKTGSGQT